MASTEPAIRSLALADLPGCLALSLSAGWNQNEADWRAMLELGAGWGIDGAAADGSRSLAASIVVVPYGAGPGAGTKACAWISMVLVLPAFRRLGHASRLLQHALAWLQARDTIAVLDATPAGYPVYIQEGFAPTWGFRRYRREAARGRETAGRAPMPASSLRIREVRPSDWPAIAALDVPVFGGDRTELLRRLAVRLPQAALVAEHDGGIAGFVLGRDGREACQIGPLVAEDESIAQGLFENALATLSTPVYVDLADRHSAMLPALQDHGFTLQRPFTRMVHGATTAPGDAGPVVLVAGPELG